MFRGLTSIVYKETIHILRDPKTLFLMMLIPGIQLVIFGYAIDLDVRNVTTVVYNLDGRQASRDLLDSFRNTGTFNLALDAGSDTELEAAIVRGDAQVGIKIPPDYTDRLLLGEPVAVQVLIDGSNSTVAMQALNVSNAIALTESLDILPRIVGQMTGPPIEVRPRVLFNPDMRTANFMVPGLVAVILQVVIMLLTVVAIVREKEEGTLEQLMVTPVSRFGLMLGKLIPFGVIGLIEIGSVLALMRFLFGVPIAGSLLLLAGFTFIYLFTVLSTGLLISTFATNQLQALQLAFLIVMPSILLSGFIFPQESMPPAIYAIGQVVPATYFIRIMRGIILRDAGFYDLFGSAGILGLIGIVVFVVSALRFRKTLA
ncbi:MAG TPA: ABC transporter permease [Candidatus Hydrogenedentes bacterium]|nr:ABC transporter permease [Candidatus Hydrogenedentota bacterium]HPG66149.1 ABC transporter permease [Candidatus Hydrogenedentota bacterium]